MRNTKIISLLFYDSVLTYKGFPCIDFGIGDVVVGTTSVTIFEDTFTRTGDWFHLPILTDELMLHHFGTVYGDDIFVFILKNAVSINFYIQMESNQDSAALAQQVQVLAATVEELTRQNKEMQLRLQQVQQKENQSKDNSEGDGDNNRRSHHQRPTTLDE